MSFYMTIMHNCAHPLPDSPVQRAIEQGRALAKLAERQHGVVSRSQLVGLGLGRGAIEWRIRTSRLRAIHRGVYVLGSQRIGWRTEWLAAVLACSEGAGIAKGEGAVLSHRSAGALWGILSPRSGPVHVTARQGRGRRGITLHHSRLTEEDWTKVDEIPVTSVARTLFDLSEELDDRGLEKAFEEADRLHLLQLRELEAICERSPGRRGLGPIRRKIELAQAPATVRSPLEERFLAFCHRNRLPPPVTNVTLLDHEVDVLWPSRRVVVELDGFEFHGHRAAFERDRTRDAAKLVAGYHVIHVIHLRLEKEADVILAQLQALLGTGSKVAPDQGRSRLG